MAVGSDSSGKFICQKAVKTHSSSGEKSGDECRSAAALWKGSDGVNATVCRPVISRLMGFNETLNCKQNAATLQKSLPRHPR